MAEDVYTRPYPTTDIYDSLRVTHPVPGTQQDAVQRTTPQHGGSNEPKNNRYRAAAGCLGTLCLLLLAAVIGLVIHNHNLTRYIKLTDVLNRLCESRGWQTFGSGCYYISTEVKNWEESRRYCRDNQSDLMVINNKEKQDFVELLNKRAWLGLTDREEEGKFVWVDGTPLTRPTYWKLGEPNNIGVAPDHQEDCVEVNELKGWNDRSCLERNRWICEIVIY